LEKHNPFSSHNFLAQPIFTIYKSSCLNIKTICVCGAGTMGSSIAQLCAQSGFSTILYEVNSMVLEQAKTSIEKNLDFLIDKKKIAAEERNNILQRISFTTGIQNCIADLCIEAIIEKAEVKISLFHQLADLNTGQAIFCSNTSSLSLNAMAAKLKMPQRFAGMHFFNPATLMKLVEVVKTNFTSNETINTLTELARQLGKTPVLCNDSPGFIVNRVARPYYIESLRLVEEGIISFEELDSIMEATGFRMGPFKLMDLIGNDVNYAVSCSVYDQLNKPGRLKPSDIQQQKVNLGELGRKSGKGYYNY
jgi:3-hydroxybutyryl-CoA dehydrogenase